MSFLNKIMDTMRLTEEDDDYFIDDDYEVEDNKLTKNKKQEDVYKLVIKDTKNIKKDSQLVIEIDS